MKKFIFHIHYHIPSTYPRAWQRIGAQYMFVKELIILRVQQYVQLPAGSTVLTIEADADYI